MSELPPEAKAWLRLAGSVDDPPEGAAERVHSRLAVVLGTATAPELAAQEQKASHAIATHGAPLSPGIKIALVAACMTGIGALGWWWHAGADQDLPHSRPNPTTELATKPALVLDPRLAKPAPPSAPVPNTDLVAQPATEPAARPTSDLVAQPATALATQPTTGFASVPGSASERNQHKRIRLGDELALLSAASTALEHGDLAQARRLLRRHRSRFPGGQLVQERRGIETLTRCLEGSAHARERAEAFLRENPLGFSNARIRAACRLENIP